MQKRTFYHFFLLNFHFHFFSIILLSHNECASQKWNLFFSNVFIQLHHWHFLFSFENGGYLKTFILSRNFSSLGGWEIKLFHFFHWKKSVKVNFLIRTRQFSQYMPPFLVASLVFIYFSLKIKTHNHVETRYNFYS